MARLGVSFNIIDRFLRDAKQSQFTFWRESPALARHANIDFNSERLQVCLCFSPNRRDKPLSSLLMNVTHDSEHYGNIVTYLRMKGLVPPSSQPSR